MFGDLGICFYGELGFDPGIMGIWDRCSSVLVVEEVLGNCFLGWVTLEMSHIHLDCSQQHLALDFEILTSIIKYQFIDFILNNKHLKHKFYFINSTLADNNYKDL
jgi:hypothetical protein